MTLADPLRHPARWLSDLAACWRTVARPSSQRPLYSAQTRCAQGFRHGGRAWKSRHPRRPLRWSTRT